MPSTKKSLLAVPFLDLKIQYRALQKEIRESLLDVMEKAAFVRGPKIEEFEEAFAAYHDHAICVGVNSGTDALFLTFKALNVKPGDEIITTPFTFVATAEAIHQTGAAVKFADVDPDRFTLDPRQLEKAITPRTVGIVPVHLFGTPADMDPILQIAKERRLWVVEDACQAHGALYKKRKAGTLGKAAAFSFYPTKNLGAYGDGGAVLTRDSALAKKVRLLRDHGQQEKYRSKIPGYNSRLDGFQAAILSVKLPHLAQWNQRRRDIAARYVELLEGIPEIQIPAVYPDCYQVYHQYAIKVRGRNQLAAFLKDQGISTAVYYAIPLHKQPAFQNCKTLSLPVSERLSRDLLSLPMFPELTHEQLEYIGLKIRQFFSKWSQKCRWS